MAIFEGTLKEFHKYLGPVARNIIQQITRSEKKGKVCEICKKNVELQAAHIHGEERTQIIEKILNENFKVENTEKYRVDIDNFFDKFKKFHLPISKHFIFLCETCHKKYDGSDEAKIAKIKSFLNALSEEEREKFLAQARLTQIKS